MSDIAALIAPILAPLSNRVLVRLHIAVKAQRGELEQRHATTMQRASELEREGHSLVEEIGDVDQVLLAIALQQEVRDA